MSAFSRHFIPDRRTFERWRRIFLFSPPLLLVVLILLSLTNFFRLRGWELNSALKEELRRASAVAETVRAIGPDQMHRQLYPPSAESGYSNVYLFDAHLEEAIFINSAGESPAESFETRSATASTTGSDSPQSSPDPSFTRLVEFDGSDTARLGEGGDTFQIQDGTLKAKSGPHHYLEIFPPAPIHWSGIDTVEIRIRANQEGSVSILLAEDPDEVPQPSDLEGNNANSQFGRIQHALSADGEFHTLFLKANTAIEFINMGRGTKISKLCLMASDARDDEIEIDYIRLNSRASKYRSLTHGIAKETFDSERRHSLFLRTPGALRFPSVPIPEQEPRLSFGLNRLDPGQALEVSVTVKNAERQEEVYRGELEGGSAWEDVGIDLSGWAGETGEISFVAEGDDDTLFWSAPALTGRSAPRMNVIVVLEDSFRVDRLDVQGGGEGGTRFKADWAKRGVVFSRAFSPSSLTRISCPSLMTSIYPVATGIRNSTDVLSQKYVTLAEVLRAHGFATASFVQNPNAGAMAGLQQGFDTYFDWDSIGRRAETLYGSKLERWLEHHRERNFFLYLHLIDPHFPYKPPEPYLSDTLNKLEVPSPKKEAEPSPPKSLLSYLIPEPEVHDSQEIKERMYEAEIAYNDDHFGQFLKHLESMELLENTLVLFVSDHGEYFGEHGGLTLHRPPNYTQVIHIPFMLSYPGKIEGGQTIDVPVSLVDVMPTILDYAGIEGLHLPMHGRSLAPLIEGEDPKPWQRRPVFADEVATWEHDEPGGWGSIVFGDWQWISSHGFRTHSNKRLPLSMLSRIYHRESDPEQEHVINAMYLDMANKFWIQRSLETIQTAHLETWQAYTRGKRESVEYDKETLDHLRDLGYLD